MNINHEFTRLIGIEGITPDKTRFENVEATPEECAAVAKRLDLRELSNFKAWYEIRRVAGNTAIRIAGRFTADVVQGCVVTLRDVPGAVKAKFETFFSENAKKDEDVDIFSDSIEDNAEMIVGGQIDLGEVAVQYLSLELDPYPRAPGVSLPAQMTENGASGKPNPFQVLAGLMKKDE
jgi:Large ribosomal RNA subunit accumulation protein YceD